MDYLPPIGLVAVIGGFWGWAVIQERRFKAAVAEAAARLNGRHEPGGRFSGGTLYLKVDGRDVVFSFQLASSLGPELTSVGCCFQKPTSTPLMLKGRQAIARVPQLQPYTSIFNPVKLRVESNMVSVTVSGVIRNADRLVDLAGIVAALCIQFDPSQPG
jgi:hypothetical protein